MSKNNQTDPLKGLLKSLKASGIDTHEELENFSESDIKKLWEQSRQEASEELFKAMEGASSVFFSEFLAKNRKLIMVELISNLAPIITETIDETVERILTQKLNEKGL